MTCASGFPSWALRLYHYPGGCKLLCSNGHLDRSRCRLQVMPQLINALSWEDIYNEVKHFPQVHEPPAGQPIQVHTPLPHCIGNAFYSELHVVGMIAIRLHLYAFMISVHCVQLYDFCACIPGWITEWSDMRMTFLWFKPRKGWYINP